MTDKKTVTRRDLEDAVVRKALMDAAFRSELTQNPRGALERALAEIEPNATLPANVQVQTLEEPQDSFYIVIPHQKPVGELSDAELEHVAGGGIGIKISIEW